MTSVKCHDVLDFCEIKAKNLMQTFKMLSIMVFKKALSY